MEKNVIMNSIYQNILTKFYEAMQNINIEQSENNMDYIKNQFNEIIELLNKCQSDIISIEAINLLYEISFNDFFRDKYIIEAVSSNKTAITDSNIFIRKMPKFIDDDCSYFRIIERDGEYIAIRYFEGNIEERVISINELNSFVSLDKVLNDSKHIGYSAHKWVNEVIILYSGKIYASENYFTLYKEYKGRNASLELYVTDKPYSTNGFFQEIYKTEKNNPYIESKSGERCINNDDGIADRAFILKVIEEQLEKQYGVPAEGKGTEKPAVYTKK